MQLWMLKLTGFACDVDLVCFDLDGLLIVMFATVGAVLIWPPFVERIRRPRDRGGASR